MRGGNAAASGKAFAATTLRPGLVLDERKKPIGLLQGNKRALILGNPPVRVRHYLPASLGEAKGRPGPMS